MKSCFVPRDVCSERRRRNAWLRHGGPESERKVQSPTSPKEVPLRDKTEVQTTGDDDEETRGPVSPYWNSLRKSSTDTTGQRKTEWGRE